jgi:hypothetical protein
VEAACKKVVSSEVTGTQILKKYWAVGVVNGSKVCVWLYKEVKSIIR